MHFLPRETFAKLILHAGTISWLTGAVTVQPCEVLSQWVQRPKPSLCSQEWRGPLCTCNLMIVSWESNTLDHSTLCTAILWSHIRLMSLCTVCFSFFSHSRSLAIEDIILKRKRVKERNTNLCIFCNTSLYHCLRSWHHYNSNDHDDNNNNNIYISPFKTVSYKVLYSKNKRIKSKSNFHKNFQKWPSQNVTKMQ